MIEPPVPKVFDALLSTRVPTPLLVKPKPPETTPESVRPWTTLEALAVATLKVAAPDRAVVPANCSP